MTELFQSFMLTSLIGTALTVILVILRPLTRRGFSVHWHYYIWLVILAVMLLPVSFDLPEPPVSVPLQTVQTTYTVTQSPNTDIYPFDSDTQDIDIEPEVIPTPVLDTKNIYALSYAWLAGVIILFLIKILSYGLFIKRLHKHSHPVECPELSSYTNRHVRVRISNKITSPLITGAIFPTLLLPDKIMNKEQLCNILAHEITHLKRGDILYKWLVAITKCVHWFNPAIYFIAHQIDVDCEISCDNTVIKNMTPQQKKSYIETILSLVSQNSTKPSPLTTGMTGKKKELKRRFIMIKNNTTFSKKSIIISIIIAVLVLSCGIFAGGILNGTFITDNSTDNPPSSAYNLLFVGVDNNQRADTIILIECNENKIHGISIPRDTLITNLRVSDIWASGGIRSLIASVSEKLNVPINYYAKLNLRAIPEIFDALGGIDFYVPMDMEYSDPSQDLNIKLKEGYFTLTGEGVKQLLQFRPGKSTHGDLSRIDIHQQFLHTFAKRKITAENLEKTQQIFRLISEHLETDYPVQNLKNNLALLTAVQNNNIYFETIPGYAATYNGVPVYELSQEITFTWPTESTTISQSFGTRTHPITGETRTHNGVDIVTPENSPVYSAISGKVTETGYDSNFGNYIIIQDNVGVKTYYGHLASILVEKDTRIEQKSLIGTVGKTGTATGANLHFEIMKNGEYYNPEEFLVSYNEYHHNIDLTDPTSVVNGFFKAFESGDYEKLKSYCSIACQDKHFMKNDSGNVFSVFGMSMAKLLSVSEPEFNKGDLFMSYTVNVSCKTPESFSILQSKNTFKVFLKKLEDNTYIIYDISY